jgi:two-component system C4-dicarboxylate transport response regulator DctD
MPRALQVKVLRAFQERSFERLGSHRSIAFDARIVVAAKVDLLAAAREGTFREDLYYRLNVAELSIPPLRERAHDIPLLFERFVEEAAHAHGRQVPRLSPDYLFQLVKQDWPGNVRELKNVAERFVLGLQGVDVMAPGNARSLAEEVASFERATIERALLACKGDISEVLNMLQLPRRTLNEKMSRYGLDRQRFVRTP